MASRKNAAAVNDESDAIAHVAASGHILGRVDVPADTISAMTDAADAMAPTARWIPMRAFTHP